MKYISIDIETTGLDPATCQVLEIGAVLEDTENQTDFENAKKFRAIIPHRIISGSPFALNMNKELIKTISDYNSIEDVFESLSHASKHSIVSLENVSSVFGNWLENECGYLKKERINVAGKNFLGFDDKFLNLIPDWQKNVKINRRVIDPAILAMDWKSDRDLPGLNQCLERAKIQKEVSHNAVEDAWDVIQVLRYFAYGRQIT